MPKPFISARIPEAVNSAIDKRSEQTGESRTDILLNALSNYLEGDIKAPISVDERLSALEEEFTQFKTELASPIQTTLLDNNSDLGSTIHSHSTSTASKDSSDNNNDNKSENRKEGEWTNKQLEAVGISRSTVEGRMRKNQLPYTKNGVTIHRRLRKEKRGRYTISIWEVSKED